MREKCSMDITKRIPKEIMAEKGMCEKQFHVSFDFKASDHIKIDIDVILNFSETHSRN